MLDFLFRTVTHTLSLLDCDYFPRMKSDEMKSIRFQFMALLLRIIEKSLNGYRLVAFIPRKTSLLFDKYLLSNRIVHK